MPYNSRKHGPAQYNSWIQLPNDFSISEGDDSEQLVNQRFAKLVYIVNSSVSSINASILAQTEQLLVPLNELKIEYSYSRIVQIDDTYTYTAHAPIGSDPSDAVWRAQRTDVNGDRQWASSGEFNSIATDLTGLSYSY